MEIVIKRELLVEQADFMRGRDTTDQVGNFVRILRTNLAVPSEGRSRPVFH